MKFIDKTYQTLILGALLVIAGVYLRPPTAVENTGFDQKELYIGKAHYAKNYDMVLAGDSRTYCALSPAEMRKILPDTIMNFGFAGTGFSKEYLDRIQTVIRTQGDNRTIVLGLSPSSITKNSLKTNGFTSSYNRGRLSIYEAMYVHKYMILVDPYELYYTYDVLLGREPIHSEWEHFPDGWVAVERSVEDTLEGVTPFLTRFDNNEVSDSVFNALLERVTQWTNEGITVIAFRPPVNDSMKAIEHNLGGFDEELVSKKFEEAGGIWFSSDNHYHSYDGSHLARDEAVRFSEEFATFIKNYRENNLINQNENSD